MKLHISKTKQLFLIFLIFSAILSIFHLVLENTFFGNTAKKIALKNAVDKISEREYILENFLNSSKSTLEGIRKLQSFNQYLKNQSNKKEIEEIFLALCNSHINIMQLRYIDKDGYEKVRIDRDEKYLSPYIIKTEKLQNKSDRYYFIDSNIKQFEEVWFSAVDLNIERGKIEIPYKPTFRAMLPINDNDKYGGVLVVNYLMEEFLKNFTNTPFYNTILFDDNGYPLYHYENNKSWGFYSKPKFNISEQFPNYYKQMISKSIVKNKNFVSKKFDFPILGGLNLVLQLKDSYIDIQKEESYERNLIITLLIFSFSLVLSIIIAKTFSITLLSLKRTEELNKELYKKNKIIIKQTYIDPLTKLDNRKSYNKNLDKLLAQYRRYKIPFSMVFFDIDHFKTVNDNYGHDIGDDVLVDLSHIVQKSIRINDYIFRIGGEEFVVLLTDTKKDKAILFAEKLRQKIESELNTIKNRVITISLGVAEVSENDTIKSIFKRADENLYYAKEHGRNMVSYLCK